MRAQEFKTIVTEAADGILVIDGDDVVLFANPASEALMGRTSAELIGSKIGQPIVPYISTEIEVLRKNGKFVTVDLRAAAITWDGAPAVLASLRDATERIQTQNELRLEKERWQSLVANAPDIVMTLDRDGTILFTNRVAPGLALDDVIGADHLDFILPPYQDLARSTAAHVFQTGDLRGYEFEAVGSDGSTSWHSTQVGPLRLGGQMAGVTLIIRDITDAKRANVEREKLEEQLRASQKMEAIGSLAGGVAHDFNNLLTVILSYTGFALNTVPEGDPLREDLMEVKNAGERAAALTRQLLAFSRKQVLASVPVDLNKNVAELKNMLGRILGEDIDLVLRLAPKLGVVRADPGQIDQVIMNLVVNARDAMPEGGTLTIETSNLEITEEGARQVAMKPGPYLTLAVTDTGHGMDDQTKSKLFEPFYTTKEKGKGTGLGLSTVHGIVNQSGGSIVFDSELGHGTRFKIYLPREFSSVAGIAAPGPVPQRNTGSETILVAEDEEPLRRVAKRVLEASGNTVLIAANGEDALRISDQYAGEIHLLLTDVIMPKMGGRVLAQELRARRPGIKVIYMSGYTDNAIVGALDQGTHFIAKPFIAEDLTQKIRNVLDADIEVASTSGEGLGEAGVDVITPNLYQYSLRAFPEALLARLRVAVVAARYDEIVEIVDKMRAIDPAAASILRRMADAFDFDGMRALLCEGSDVAHGR